MLFGDADDLWIQWCRSGCVFFADEFDKRFFVEDVDAELFGFCAFGAGFFACDDEVGFAADAGGGFAAEGADEVLSLLAAPSGEGAGDDHCFVFEGFGTGVGRGFGFEGDACCAEFFDDGPVAVDVEVCVDAFCYGGAYFVYGFDFFGRCVAQAVNAVEVVG